VSCSFCDVTPVAVCPMCSGAPAPAKKAPKSRDTKPKPRVITARRVVPPVTRWSGMGAREKAKHLAAAQQLWSERDANSFAAQLAHLADPEKKDIRLSTMVAIDERAVKAGRLSIADDHKRHAIIAECIAELGFDPRDATLATAYPELKRDEPVYGTHPTPSFGPAQLGDGVVHPLRAGDWAELERRVRRGLLSEADAFAFGEQWMKQS
jgi:hypothetical protein